LKSHFGSFLPQSIFGALSGWFIALMKDSFVVGSFSPEYVVDDARHPDYYLEERNPTLDLEPRLNLALSPRRETRLTITASTAEMTVAQMISSVTPFPPSGLTSNKRSRKFNWVLR
jgi:hypothetical protein